VGASVVTCCDPPPVLELAEHVLDLVALAVERLVMRDGDLAAVNFGRRLKTLSGLTPYEYICKQWTSEPERFRLNPIHQMPGLNT
jgi:hypothetical protein